MSIPAETPKPKVYLRKLYASEKIVIDPTDGTRTIAQAGDVFAWGIDGDFRKWNLDVLAQATVPMEVGVHELIMDGAFENVYGSLGQPLDRLCLTQAQIIGFCMGYKDKLHQGGYRTFFLFKVGGEFFVANVCVSSDGRLDANVRRFSGVDVWCAEYRHRFVSPQLEPSVA